MPHGEDHGVRSCCERQYGCASCRLVAVSEVFSGLHLGHPAAHKVARKAVQESARKEGKLLQVD